MEPVRNTTGTLTRRGFLKTTATAALVAGSASAAGFAALTPKTASAQSDEKICTTYCNACMGCPLEAVVRDGNVVLTRAKEIEGAPIDQKRMCARGASIPTLIVQEKRIQYPMKRAEGTERGAGQWERISWDEAIDTICAKIKEYQAEFGSGSVCSFTYGTTEPRNMYNLNRLENVAQFSHQNRTTDFALTQGTMYTAGGFYYQGGADMDLVSQMSTFVVWGHNPIVSWPNAWHYIADAIENNDCKLIVVDPNKNTIGQKADLFVSLQPGTDAALALGLAKIIEEEGKTDDAFMQQKSCAPFLVKESDGRFLRKSDLEEGVAADADDFAVWDEATNAMGYASTAQNPVLRKKGIEVAGQRCNTAYSLLIDRISEYPIEMVSEVTTVPEEAIRTFADLLCRPGMADIFQGYGIDHYGHGFNTIAAVSVLRIMRGMVPEPRMSYPLNSSGFDETETEHPAIVQSLGTFMFNDLLDTGKYTFPGVTAHMGEQVMELPDVTVEQPLKMLISFGANIVNSAPDRNKTIEAYKKFDFLVTANIEWCDTADISDIVLPAATIQEVGGPIGMNGCLVWADKAVEPKFEAKSDYDMANLIGRGLGLDEWFQEEFDEGMKHVVNTAMSAAMGIDADKLKEAGVMYVGAVPMPAYMTMTGKLQFYQENPGPIENYGQPMDPASIALPHWEPPMEAWPVTAGGFDANPLAEKYPLIVTAGTRRFRVHSYYGQNPLLREMEINEPCVRINPVDAEARGIEDGSYVRLFNDRGHAVAKATFSAGIRPGCLDIDRGWQRSQYLSGCNNDLTSKQIVDWTCPTYAYHDCLVEIEPWDGVVAESQE